jgi:hypothetical protein
MKTTIKVLPEQWDFNKAKYRSVVKGSLELNNELDTLANVLLKQYSKLKDERQISDESEIKELLQSVLQTSTPVKRDRLDEKGPFLLTAQWQSVLQTVGGYRFYEA